MNPNAREAIHAVRIKRLKQAIEALETALADGRAVSDELLRVSGLLERGIDPKQLRAAFADLPRLLEVAQEIEAQQAAARARDPRRPSRRMPV